MNTMIKNYNLIPAVLIFIGLPLLIWALGDFTERTILKESLSVLTLLSFCLMLAQFFLTRSNKIFTNNINRSTVIKIHKFIGYLFIIVLLVHPFLIVFPRYFESGIDPMEAFITLITTFTSLGVVLGMVAWFLMLLLVVTALFRKKLPMKVKTWRVYHGVLSMLFIALAVWHALDLGRHTHLSLSTYIIFILAGGILLLLKTYLIKTPVKGGSSK